MSPLARLHPTTEGRRGSRIDLEEGGCYLGIPRNRSGRAFTSVQGTGCGTEDPNGSGREQSLVGTGLHRVDQRRQGQATFKGDIPILRRHLQLCAPEDRPLLRRSLRRRVREQARDANYYASQRDKGRSHPFGDSRGQQPEQGHRPEAGPRLCSQVPPPTLPGRSGGTGEWARFGGDNSHVHTRVTSLSNCCWNQYACTHDASAR